MWWSKSFGNLEIKQIRLHLQANLFYQNNPSEATHMRQHFSHSPKAMAFSSLVVFCIHVILVEPRVIISNYAFNEDRIIICFRNHDLSNRYATCPMRIISTIMRWAVAYAMRSSILISLGLVWRVSNTISPTFWRFRQCLTWMGVQNKANPLPLYGDL